MKVGLYDTVKIKSGQVGSILHCSKDGKDFLFEYPLKATREDIEKGLVGYETIFVKLNDIIEVVQSSGIAQVG